MSQLIAIRHAQASLFSDDYDQLSSLGQEQAEALGRYLNEHQARIDRLVVGPCRRHLQTAEQAALHHALPQPETMPDLAEHEVDRIVINWLEEQEEGQETTVGALVADYHRAKEANDRQAREKSFHRLFELATSRWIHAEASLPIESWVLFRSRVESAFETIRNSTPAGSNVMVVTSVGPISVLMGSALQCDATVAIATGWRIRNCSVSRFLFSGEQLTLDSFNSTHHLVDRDVTFR